MKTLTRTLILLSATAISFSQNTIAGETFSKIKIEGNAKINIRQDSACAVIYTGNDNASNSAISIKNETLIISGRPDNQLTVTLPELSEININGYGNVYGTGKFTSDALKLDLDGDGKIILDIDVKTLNAKISGLGKITLSGTAQEASLSIPGSGKIDAISLRTIRCNANISGLGKCMVDVIDELNADISGSGAIAYKTAPKKINENISGIGKIKMYSDEGSDSSTESVSDTFRFELGKKQVWFIGKKDSTHANKHKVKPIWAGLELGINSYLDNGGSITLSPGKENFELKTEKSVSVALNLFQKEVEIAKSNVWLFTGLGITWNNYRFENDIVVDNGSYITTHHDTTPGVEHQKSKLVSSYLTAPVMLELFTSRNIKKAFHLGAGAMLGLRIGSHTKNKVEIDGNVQKLKEHDDFNLSPFRYGFRVAVGYGKFNLFADYYASTLFKENKGPVLYPVNVGFTLAGF